MNDDVAALKNVLTRFRHFGRGIVASVGIPSSQRSIVIVHNLKASVQTGDFILFLTIKSRFSTFCIPKVRF